MEKETSLSSIFSPYSIFQSVKNCIENVLKALVIDEAHAIIEYLVWMHISSKVPASLRLS